jgi:uncharacterized protein
VSSVDHVMDDQGLTWLTPSPRMWRARMTMLAICSGALMVLAGLMFGYGVSPLAAVIAIAVLLVGSVAVGLLLRRRYRSWGYAERADDLLVRRGVMVRRLTVVPYGRMQFIDVTAGPVDRSFKLATVQLHTAAAATDARIPGLERAEADRLRDRLAALGEARAAGL